MYTSTHILLGSHNTMSYLEPSAWYMRPFRFIARCQSLTLEEQFKAGARFFDFRVAFDSRGYSHFCHGLMSFQKISPVDDLTECIRTLVDLCKSNNTTCYIRIILNERRQIDFQEKCMKALAERINTYYASSLVNSKYIHFIPVTRLFDGALVYTFYNRIPKQTIKLNSFYSSCFNLSVFPWYKRIIYSVCPKAFAHDNNEELIRGLQKPYLYNAMYQDIYVIDFIKS